MIRFFDPGAGYLKIKPEIDEAITRVLTKGDLILREDVEQFEKSLAAYVGTKYAVGLNSGTDALYLALKAMDIGPGDEVLVSSHTFVATVQVIELCGATPVLFDLNGEITITDRTKVVIPCHIAGEISAKMEAVVELCSRQGIAVIEDACQALGAVQNGKSAGSFGVAGAFSFYPAKILGAYGDAGALVTNDPDIYEYVKEARNHFKNDYRTWGVNSRLDNIQAAILNVKMRGLVETQMRRQRIAEIYSANLKGVVTPKHTHGRVWQDYIVECSSAEQCTKLFEHLKARGIETMRNNYPFPIEKLPESLRFEACTLRLPINENISNEDVMEIINAINEF
jgi:dTDP-4-amino-4,6-dideoxygalactose transaminase